MEIKFEGITVLCGLTNPINDIIIKYDYDSITSEVIDCYFTTDKEENYKRKFILKRRT